MIGGFEVQSTELAAYGERDVVAMRMAVRVLFMSGYHEDVRLRRGIPEGGVVLEKPFRPDELPRRVRDAIEDGPTASSL